MVVVAGGDHSNPGSQFSPGKRGELLRQRDQVLRRYILSRDSHYRHRRRSAASHS